MLSNRSAVIAGAAALVLTAAIACLLFRVPLPHHDNTLLSLPLAPSATAVFLDTMHQPGFMRPASRATSKLVFDAAAGREYLAFRSLHVLMVLVILVGAVRLLEVRTPVACALALVALAAIIGMHPFHEAARETDLNIKLLVPAMAIGTLWLSAAGTATLWRDLLALLLLVYGLLSNELGLLLWVSLAAAYLVGMRGVSGRAVAIATMCVAGYLALRFGYLNVGAPGLIERGSGYGFRTYEPPELIAMFGDNPLRFYAYNIVASVLTVIASEPRGGVFIFVRELLANDLHSGTAINVVTSLATTALMAAYVIRRWRDWRALTFTPGDRLFLVGAAVLAGNAVISYPYLKDVTMSTGAVFYALAMVPPLQMLVTAASGARMARWRVAAVTVLLAVISVGWTIRAGAFAIDMRREAHVTRLSWEGIYEYFAERGTPESEFDRAFVNRFRAEMLAIPVPPADPGWIRDLDPH